MKVLIPIENRGEKRKVYRAAASAVKTTPEKRKETEQKEVRRNRYGIKVHIKRKGRGGIDCGILYETDYMRIDNLII